MVSGNSRVPEIEALLAAVRDGQVVGNAAAAYAAIEALRKQADKYERDLIRSLRWEDDNETVRYKWREISELVDAQLGSRQASWARWKRLTDDNRRTETGDYRRGRARPGRPPVGSESVP